MNANTPFIRKVVYLGIIVLLLFPLFWIGRPGVRSEANEGQGGGMLAEMRHDMGLAQSELGEIDPASETMKLATLGLRGVATSILWSKTSEYKTKENWDKLAATLNTLRRLTPNYISVWEFQAWNMSYNVSAEFDFFEHRYQWVKRGIEYLMEGTKYNRRNPRMLWNLGWFTGQKFGRSDEHRQFRVLYRNDVDFHDIIDQHIPVDNARASDGKPDNWLTAHLWYLRSQEVDARGIPITWLRLDVSNEGITDKRRSAVIFYNDAPMSLVNFAKSITKELTPGEITRNAWDTAGVSLGAFGNREIPTATGPTIRLNDFDKMRVAATGYHEQLDFLADPDAMRIRVMGQVAAMPSGLRFSPTARDRLRYQKEGDLTDAERAALAIPFERRNPDQFSSGQDGLDKLTISDEQLLESVPEADQVRGNELIRLAGEAEEVMFRISGYRNIVNYGYWRTRCEVEQKRETADARRLMLKGDELKDAGDPEGAIETYEQAWDLWADILDEYPDLIHDVMGEDLNESVQNYEVVLSQLDRKFPEDFKLAKLRDYYKLEAEYEAGRQ